MGADGAGWRAACSHAARVGSLRPRPPPPEAPTPPETYLNSFTPPVPAPAPPQAPDAAAPPTDGLGELLRVAGSLPPPPQLPAPPGAPGAKAMAAPAADAHLPPAADAHLPPAVDAHRPPVDAHLPPAVDAHRPPLAEEIKVVAAKVRAMGEGGGGLAARRGSGAGMALRGPHAPHPAQL